MHKPQAERTTQPQLPKNSKAIFLSSCDARQLCFNVNRTELLWGLTVFSNFEAESEFHLAGKVVWSFIFSDKVRKRWACITERLDSLENVLEPSISFATLVTNSEHPREILVSH